MAYSDTWWEQQFARHRSHVYAAASRLCRNAELADDLVQRALASAWEKRHQYDPNTVLRGGDLVTVDKWLLRIAVNAYRMHVRKRANRELPFTSLTRFVQGPDESYSGIDTGPHEVVPCPRSEQAFSGVENRAILREARRHMSDREWKAVNLIARGHSYPEVAQQLGMSYTGFRAMIQRMQKRMRELMPGVA